MSRQIVASKDPAFEEARETLGKLKKRCQSAQRSLSRFEEKDVPQYHSWLNKSFGKEFEEASRLREEVIALAEVMELTEDLRFITTYSEAECYRRAKHCFEHPDAPNPYRDCFWKCVNGEEIDEADEETDSDSFDEEDLLHDLFRETASAFGIDPDAAEAEWDHFRDQTSGADSTGRAASAPRAPGDGPEKGDLKKTYRQLARQLHPDHRDEPEAQKHDTLDQLWHQAQDAYTRGDLQSLRQIQAMIETEVRGIDANTSLDHLHHAIEGIRDQLRPIERDVRKARKSPAWMFSKKRENRLLLRNQIEYSLRYVLRELRQDLDLLRRQRIRLEKLAERDQ